MPIICERLVARLLEDVAREDAEPAGVDRHRLVEAELGAHEDDGPVDPGAPAVRPRELCVELGRERPDALEELGVRARRPPASRARGR